MTAPKPDDQPSDQSLVLAFRDGDERAAATLVHRHAEALARFLYSSGADRADLDDLVQETFYRAFRAISTWRREATFRSWLFRIGANLRRDQFRRRRGRVVVSLLEQDVVDGSDPAGEAEARESEDRLRDEIARLPRLQREVFLLRVQEGLDYDAIATACGTTPGAARVHYHHAVKRLKEHLV